MKGFLIIILAVLTIPVLGQIKSENLKGEWTACNKDSLYYKSEKLVLYQDANYYVEAKCCYYVKWQISSKKKIRLENSFTCTEPGRVNSSNAKESFRLVDCEGGQMIVLKRDGKEVDKFKVIELEKKEIDRYPHEIKILTLQRE